MTVEEMRSNFPYLENGLVYLNHAATAPWSRPLDESLKRYREGRLLGGVDMFPKTLETVTAARGMAADMLGSEADRIAFTQNTSEGLNILAAGLDWRPGDRIVIPDREFPANVYPFLNLARKGVEIDFVPQEKGRVAIDDIARAITPRTRLVTVSWVQFLSGYRLDLTRLGALCRDRGVLLAVDAIQGLGAMALDCREAQVDFLSAGVQKWQLGPQGLAVVYVRRELQEQLQQSSLGWLSVKEAWDFFEYRADLLDTAERYENGTPNSMGIWAYHGAMSLFREVGFDVVEARIRELVEYTWNRAAAAGYHMLTPADAGERAGIVTFAHDDADAVQSRLQRNGVVVSSRAGFLRVAPHFYTTQAEVDTFFAALDAGE